MALSKGCSIALIIVGIIVVILIAIGIYVYVNRDKIAETLLDKALSYIESEMIADLPEGYTEESVHQILQDFKAAVKDGRVDQQTIQELQGRFQMAMSDQKLDAEESASLLRSLQEAMGMEVEEMEELPDSLPAVPDTP